MSTWYYYERKGPFTGEQLKELARQGTITPETYVGDESGQTSLARNVKGLLFPKTHDPNSPPSPDLQAVKDWIKGWGVYDENTDFEALISLAIANNRVDAVEYLMSRHPGIDIRKKLHERNDDGQTVMFSAANSGHIKMIKWLKKQGADIDARGGKYDMTPLIFVARTAIKETIECLVDQGANVNATTNNGMTPLHFAAAEGNIEGIKSLAALGAKVEARDNVGWTPMFHAAGQGQTESIKCLKALGADINARVRDEDVVDPEAKNNGDNKGRTPLLLAVDQNQTESIKCLVKLGADLNAKNDAGMTPTTHAVMRGHVESLKCSYRSQAAVSRELI